MAVSAERVLVVNADDLGLHLDINRGIERAHGEGIVRSASLSAAGDAFDDALELCRRNPELDVGVHLTLVEERPLTDPERLGRLVTAEGRFVSGYGVLVPRMISGAVSEEAVRRELTAQVERVIEAGIRPSHLDGHQHVHLLPRVWPVVTDLARRHSIPWIRVPRFRPVNAGSPSFVVTALRCVMNVLQRRRRHSLSVGRSPDATPALGFSGHLTADRILRDLDRIPSGLVSELVTHPGVQSPELEASYDWGFDWDRETAALTDPSLRASLEDAGFRLTTFAELAS